MVQNRECSELNMAHYETYDPLKSELYGIIICICVGKVIQENTREEKTANERLIYNIFYFCSNEMLHLLVDIVYITKGKYSSGNSTLPRKRTKNHSDILYRENEKLFIMIVWNFIKMVLRKYFMWFGRL